MEVVAGAKYYFARKKEPEPNTYVGARFRFFLVHPSGFEPETAASEATVLSG